ncbi:hypothetical protein ACF0H5_015490 [Mactra antiquata]
MARLFIGLVYLTSFSWLAVEANPETCNALISLVNILYYRERQNEKSYDEMYVMSHGTNSNKKCRFIQDSIEQLGFGTICEPTLSTSCPIHTKEIDTNMSNSNFQTIHNVPVVCHVTSRVCNHDNKYRTLDGSCNNVENPTWGRAIIAQRRVLPNAYDDGFGQPRTRGCNGPLPSARHVSNVIHSTDSSTFDLEPSLSYLFVQFGQFLAHDFVETKLFTGPDGNPLMCCDQDKDHAQCNPITIPQDDKNFPPGGCLNFARSNSLIDCSLVRQAINSQTSFLDLSIVYGPSEEESRHLRTFYGGKMKTVLNKLPVDYAENTCSLSRPAVADKYYCPLSGDARSNEMPGLTSMHTLYVREHNRIADGLASVNPHLTDETLFEEARKINIAIWQHVVYSEYLPLLLSDKTLTKYKLKVKSTGFQDFYDKTLDPSVSNAFAVAAFRYGHTQVHKVIGMMDNDSKNIIEPQPLEKHFFEPILYHSFNDSGMDSMLRWSSSERCPLTDRKIENSIRTKLFLDDHMNSFDLISINIQRGRDHGKPGYNAFRQWCNLSQVQHFTTDIGGLVDHDKQTADLLQQVYACPDDIDLFTGFISEKRSPGSLLGPTGQCIIASEFQRVRNGDRFFYERQDSANPSTGFTEAQLNSIKKSKLAALVCRNTNTTQIQPDVFTVPYRFTQTLTRNVPKNCSSWEDIDFKLWKQPLENSIRNVITQLLG